MTLWTDENGMLEAVGPTAGLLDPLSGPVWNQSMRWQPG